ncbi:MAG: MotA/TolQ/ExbB proton channel family protein [Planctomycetaceae bacterium]|jgi:biopolymer transport protein ExbB/TolQ|nr:MotA/TolQ/ExbB proton channel family protein [Planctomycetaceae bacterium]
MNNFNQDNRLSWQRNDIELLFGVRSNRFTAVHSGVSVALALTATVFFYAILYLMPHNWFTDMFTLRGFTPYLMVLLAFWSAIILLFKWTKIRLQWQALRISILPESTFVLSPNTVDQVMQNINLMVEQPKHFFLFNRIVGALSNLKNIGMISDVSDILRTYNEQDEESVETSYSLLNGFLWAIPVLGFIGTVQGLSVAIGEFGRVLQQGGNMEALTSSLQTVTGGLATAFETTLVALVFALFLHLWATAMRKTEEELLHACSEYCSQNIVGHLRMIINREESGN